MEQLEKALAEKEEELNGAVQKRRWKTVEDMETLLKTGNAQAALKESP